MNKKTFTAADFRRKPYAKPLIKVAVIGGADIICTSGNTEDYDDQDGNSLFLP